MNGFSQPLSELSGTLYFLASSCILGVGEWQNANSGLGKTHSSGNPELCGTDRLFSGVYKPIDVFKTSFTCRWIFLKLPLLMPKP